ncbi:MAG: DUF493 domain-containing protein [Duodenibacillus sp.]|nr:DUF493 domain-containing protein [Duodenibacillus sp.]
MSDELLQFPSDFLLKIVGDNSDHYEGDVAAAIAGAGVAADSGKTARNLSRNGKYLALSVTVHVESKAELDAVYKAVTALPSVRYML